MISRYETMISRYQTMISRYKTMISRYETMISRYETMISRYETMISRYETMISRYEFVLQTDWSGGVVWSQYHFRAVGLPLYHRDKDRDSAGGARRWRRLCAPLAFCSGAWEDPPNINLMFVWCERLLRHLLTHNGLNHPKPLVSQILGDWSLSLRKASGPVTSNLLNDEHITRRIERREDLPWSKAHVHRLLRMAAFCPHGAVVAVCWHYLLREAPENVMKHITPGGQDFPVSDMWIPRFWSGSFSPARPGNSCSQQGAELMIKTIKKTASPKNETRSEKEFLNSLERRYQIASTTETANHGFIGNSQELRLPSLKVQEYSPDILTGTGCSWKCMKDQRKKEGKKREEKKEEKKEGQKRGKKGREKGKKKEKKEKTKEGKKEKQREKKRGKKERKKKEKTNTWAKLLRS